MNELNIFTQTAIRLARNPLGIIALFVVLIYGIACWTFTSAKALPPEYIKYFVVFILLYPLIILIVFYKLVTKHHTKLYAPEDFPIHGDFVKCALGDQGRPAVTVSTQVLETPNGNV